MDPKFFRQYLDILNERVVIGPDGKPQPRFNNIEPGPEPTDDQMADAEEKQRAALGLPSLAAEREATYQRQLKAYQAGDNRGAGPFFKPRPGDELLKEFGADNGPIGVAGRQPQPTTPAPQQGVSRFANTADAYDQGIDGPEGERTTINTSTGQKQISNAGGTTTVDTTRGAVPVSQSTPNIGGYQQTTYTGSAGKGPASGAQTTSYSSGPLDVTRDTDAAGKQTSSSATYDMGVAKATASQQGDENAPVQTSMQYTQPVQEVGLPHGQDVHDTLDPKYPYYGPNTTTKEKLQYRLGQDERGAARARAGQQRSIHARNKPQLPEDVELQRLKEFLSKPY